VGGEAKRAQGGRSGRARASVSRSSNDRADNRNDSYHTSNPFTNLTNIVSALTTLVQLDVYSLSRESLQRMLPAAPATAPVTDDREFHYRFSMAYVRALPEAQRPVERESFGELTV